MCPPSRRRLDFADAIRALQLDGIRRYVTGFDHVPWLPIPMNRRVAHAKKTVYQLADKMVGLGAQQPADEILSLLFAGTESPANTLCWALKLLEGNPRLEKQARR